MYALAPIVFLVLYKSPKLGVVWNLVLLLMAVLFPLFNRMVMDLPHIYELLKVPNLQKLMIGWATHYWSPINYFQTYIIGILLAYMVRHKPKIYLGGTIGEVFIWIITSFTTMGILYWQRNFFNTSYTFEALNGLELHVYLVFHKLLYLSGFAWLIYACTTGRGGETTEMPLKIAEY